MSLFDLISGDDDDLFFDGATYEPAADKVRLGKQMKRVFDLMSDSRWRTMAEIARVTGDPEASVSARLRDLRKRRFGSHAVERRRRGLPQDGLWGYRLTVRVE